jgi:hypothetical protein
MNPDAATWLAGCIILLIMVPTAVFTVWAYLESVQAREDYDRLVKERRLQGWMQIKEIKLYSLEPPLDSGHRLVSK